MSCATSPAREDPAPPAPLKASGPTKPPGEALTVARNLAFELHFDTVADLSDDTGQLTSPPGCAHERVDSTGTATASDGSGDVLGGGGAGLAIYKYADDDAAYRAATWWLNCREDLTPQALPYRNFVIVGSYLGGNGNLTQVKAMLTRLYGNPDN